MKAFKVSESSRGRRVDIKGINAISERVLTMFHTALNSLVSEPHTRARIIAAFDVVEVVVFNVFARSSSLVEPSSSLFYSVGLRSKTKEV